MMISIADCLKRFYFLRCARVIASFSSSQFLGKLAPTLHTCIYWVKANIMSIGKSGARVQLPVTTMAKRRKWLTLQRNNLVPSLLSERREASKLEHVPFEHFWTV